MVTIGVSIAKSDAFGSRTRTNGARTMRAPRGRRYSHRVPARSSNKFAASELSKNDLAGIVKTLQDGDIVGFVAAMTERSLGVRCTCRLRRLLTGARGTLRASSGGMLQCEATQCICGQCWG